MQALSVIRLGLTAIPLNGRELIGMKNKPSPRFCPQSSAGIDRDTVEFMTGVKN